MTHDFHPDGPVIIAGEARIPVVGCGTWQLRGELCAEIVAKALEVGFRHVDTAQGYDNEAAVGEGLRASGIPRDRVFVTTKVRPQLVSEGALQKSVEESLERLQLDRVDLVLIHWPNPDIAIGETMKALSDAKRRGLTSHIGVSNFTVAHLDEAMRQSPEPVVTNQVEYHPYVNQRKILAANRRHGLATTAYCPIALGRVVGDPVIEAIAAAHGRSAVQIALRWLIQQEDVAVIPRTSKPQRLSENLSILDFELTDSEMNEMGSLARGSRHLVNEPAWVPAWD
jgi:2,5-diketo-D-gluconate reductase B